MTKALDPGKLVGGVWLPELDMHLEENMVHGSDSAWRDGKLTYQTYKLDAAMEFQPKNRFRTCIDIGAHVGLWSMWLAKLFEEVHAFDPLKKQHEHLFLRNVPDKNVTFHPYAIGDRTDIIDMKTRPHKSCISFVSRSSLRPEDAAKKVQPNKRTDNEHKISFEIVKAKMRNLDCFHFENVDFIKIDTEGFELYVIKGALKTIKRCRPNIVIEQAGLDMYYGHERNAAVKVLERLGMKCKVAIGPDHIMTWK